MRVGITSLEGGEVGHDFTDQTDRILGEPRFVIAVDCLVPGMNLEHVAGHDLNHARGHAYHPAIVQRTRNSN
jgi:hypothetical protein